MELTQEHVHILENGANIFQALVAAKEVAVEALGLQQAFSERRRHLEAVDVEIAAHRADALQIATLAVEAQTAHQAQLRRDEDELEALRLKLQAARATHDEVIKAQEQEFTTARSELRQAHEQQRDAFNDEIDRLRMERDAIAADLAALRAKIN